MGNYLLSREVQDSCSLKSNIANEDDATTSAGSAYPYFEGGRMLTRPCLRFKDHQIMASSVTQNPGNPVEHFENVDKFDSWPTSLMGEQIQAI